jgi:hypothetical protein
MDRFLFLTRSYFALLSVCILAPQPVLADDPLIVSPVTIKLVGPEATQQLLVRSSSGADLTRMVRYDVEDSKIVQVDTTGLVVPRAEGSTGIRVQHGQYSERVTVEVTGLKLPQPVSFGQQILPLLSKAGCNSGSCHGKAEGQNGFKLSVFGFDPEADYHAIVDESRGRRIFPARPDESLLVAKATGRVPHGGGKKIAEDSIAYRRLIRWISEGAVGKVESAIPIASITVEPADQVLLLGGTQQLRVTAIDERGNRYCVTTEAEYESNAPTLAGVDRRGFVSAGSLPGEAAILVRYLGHVAVSRITIPKPGVSFPRPPENNFIDTHVWNKLARLGIPPSNEADGATFLRRVFLDTIGTLPTAQESLSFLNDSNPNKRSLLIDALLERREYADYWAMKWADLLRVDRDALTAPGAVAMSRWLRRQFAENRPYDQFARDIVTAEGGITREGPAGFFRVLEKPEVMSRSISQLFLGVRIECAQCHHHPSDRWSQDDYIGLAGFFTGVSRRTVAGGDTILAKGGTDLNHPRTGQPIPARALGQSAVTFAADEDRRKVFADWMTSADNPYFARAIANRLWSHYFGRGLIEPVDDLRSTNPATNELLLHALTNHLKETKYDLKAFTRTLLQSRAYQLGPATAANRDDEQNFSHTRPRPLPAEVLLDAVSQATGVPEKFSGWPEGVRAIELWDNRVPSYFLTLFGRPARTSVCECERSGEPSIAQALHLMNAPEIEAKIHSSRGLARTLVRSDKTPAAIVDELFLGTLSRFPTDDERRVMLELFKGEKTDRRAAVEDVMWVLLNSKEFVFNH